MSKRVAAMKASLKIKKNVQWLNDSVYKFAPEAMTQPDDVAYISAFSAHQATIKTHFKADGTRGGHIGKGSGAAYDIKFNGTLKSTEFKITEDRDLGLFREGEEGDEEESVPLKWRRLKPKYSLSY